MASRRSVRSKSPRKSKSPKRSASTKRSKSTGSKRAMSDFQKFLKSHTAAIKAEMAKRGMKWSIAAYTKVGKEMFLASGGKMASPKVGGKRRASRLSRKSRRSGRKSRSTRRKSRLSRKSRKTRKSRRMSRKGRKMSARTPSPVRARRVSALKKYKSGSPMTQSVEQRLRALFSRSPSMYSPTTGRTRRSLVRKARKSTKKTGTRKANAYALWAKSHMAQARAAHPGLKPMAAVAKLYKEMGHTAKPRKTPKTKRGSRKVKTSRKARKSTKGSRKPSAYALWVKQHKAAIKAKYPGVNFIKAAAMYKKSSM